MENEVLMIATGYALTRLSLLALVGYAVYRVLTGTPNRVPVKTRSRYARERPQASRNQR